MKILTGPVSLQDLRSMAGSRFGNLVKAVVDVQKRIMAVVEELVKK